MKDPPSKNDLLVVAILFFILTWLSVSLRIYVRGFLQKTWGKDDSFMVVSLIIFTIYLAFQLVAVTHGQGRHRWDLEDDEARIGFLFYYLCEILYVFTNCTLKIALATFYLRVAINIWHIWIIKLLMVGTVFFGMVYFFLVVFQCTPVSEFWNNHPASNKCIPHAPTQGISYALAAVNAMADWTFGILPFFIVLDLEGMAFKTKILVAGILAFAAIGSTATVVRMKYIHTLINGPDFLFATTGVSVWSTVEPGIGITAGSIATLRPLFRLWHLRLSSSPLQPPSPTPSPRHRHHLDRSQTISELLAQLPSAATTTTTTKPSAATKESWNCSSNQRSHTRSVEGRTKEEDKDELWAENTNGMCWLSAEGAGPPQLHLRESIHRMFIRRSIMSSLLSDNDDRGVEEDREIRELAQSSNV
ncbi:hypothetical protein DM02DRAFT_589253 [Periconia macrospinosa]|uniref:Rhodopsin domain-containing protein n=1 Tax=Periconia macrospinosa TaxID=97972 RepID=A0A2V1DX28_9PLEO|nr:hypothetical protein DM02DRAFT_589253 [Periconia macrospinosa]